MQIKDSPIQGVISMDMQKFLLDLAARIKAVSLKKCQAPEGAVEKGVDTPVGTLPPALQKLYFVHHESTIEMDARCEAEHSRMKELTDKPKSEATLQDRQFVASHILAHELREIVSDLFWHAVREFISDSHPEIAGAKSIGLREDWQVVISKSPASGSVVEISVLGPFPIGRPKTATEMFEDFFAQL